MRARVFAALVRFTLLALVLLLLLEASARVAIYGPRGLDPRRVRLLRDLDPAELVHFETEPDIVYEYKPDLDVFFKGVPFRTNSRGMRDREYALAKPPGTFRVAVLGSSYSLPAGVEIEGAYHSLLEERCARARAPGSCEFLNFSVGMHGPSQFLAMLRHRALAFEPDLVLVGVTALAAPRMLASFRDTPPRDMLKLVRPRPRSLLVKWIESRLGRGQLAPGSRAFPPALPESEQVIAQLGALARGRSLPIVLVRLEYDARPPTGLERELEARARREGMRWVDTRSAFHGTDPRSLWIDALDPHPNRRAHALFADVIGEFLRRENLLGVSGSRTRTERSAARP